MEAEELSRTLREGPVTTEFLSNLKIASREAGRAQALGRNAAFMALLVGRPEGEARRVLANIMYHSPEARRWWAATESFAGAVATLGESLGASEEERFLTLRLLFLATIEDEVAVRAAPAARTLLAAGQRLGSGRTGAGRTDNLVDILRILYNIRKQNPPLDLDEPILALITTILGRGDDAAGPVVLGNVFNLAFLLAPETLAGLNPEALLKALESLAALYRGGSADERRSAADHLSVACLLLTRLCEGAGPASLRSCLRQKILPSRFDRHSPTDATPLKATLARLLQHPEDRVSLAVGDFIFALLRRRLPRLIYHFGYGCCAGFLYARDLLVPEAAEGPQLGSLDDLGESSDEETIKGGGLDGWDPVTGRLPISATDAGEAASPPPMTEAEREAEGERLAELFDRLERTGIVKIYPQKHDDGQ